MGVDVSGIDVVVGVARDGLEVAVGASATGPQ